MGVAIGLVGVLVALAIPVAVVLVAVHLARGRRPGDGGGVRRFFQLGLLYVLGVLVATGAAHLLALPLTSRDLVVGGLGLDWALSFVGVGGAVLVALVVWTRRLLRDDPVERETFAWAAYLTVASLTAAGVATVAVSQVVAAALVDGEADLPAVVRLVVWGGVWAVHWALQQRTLRPAAHEAHLTVGALAGLVLVVVGLVVVTAAALDAAARPAGAVLVAAEAGVLPRATGEGLAVLAAGLPLWGWYWLGRLRRRTGALGWLVQVLLAGVGGGLVMAVAGATTALYRVAVWSLGDPTTDEPLLGWVSTALAAGVVGALCWVYHRVVLARGVTGPRTEVARVHDYLLSGIALVTAAVGLVRLTEVAVGAATRVGLVGRSADALLAGLTLLVVGGGLWWLFWGRVRRAVAAEPVAEASARSRRVYLVLLFGVGAVVAVVALIVVMTVTIGDVLRGSVDDFTLARLGVPLGLLVAAGLVSGYHWVVEREDRGRRQLVGRTPQPRRVLLLGAQDPGVVAAVRQGTGAVVELWPDPQAPAWDAAAVVAAVRVAGREHVVVEAEPGGLRVRGAGAVLTTPAGPERAFTAGAGAGEAGAGDQGRGSEVPGQVAPVHDGPGDPDEIEVERDA